jgi:hypothetical protein
MAIKCARLTIKYRGLWTCICDPKGAFIDWRRWHVWSDVLV